MENQPWQLGSCRDRAVGMNRIPDSRAFGVDMSRAGTYWNLDLVSRRSHLGQHGYRRRFGSAIGALHLYFAIEGAVVSRAHRVAGLVDSLELGYFVCSWF